MRMTPRALKAYMLAIIGIASLTLLIGFTEKPNTSFELQGTISVAHRGASGYAPENTMAAFQKAVDHGMDYIELDIHLSKDDQLVIIHDDKVNRTTNGSGYVRNFTLEELKELDAGSKFNASFKGERIITLEELLDTMLHQIGIIIEIKEPEANTGIEQILADLIEQYNNTNNVIIQSVNFESMKKMHELLPKIPVAVLVSRTEHPLSSQQLDDIADYATYVNYNIRYLRQRDVEEIHKRDKKVMAWTIRDPRKMQKALNLGVDGIITDYTKWIVDSRTAGEEMN
ncbi:glycerophosphodiester phosphodiesterase [Bacillus sp. SD088]|nr:glycerophosphodiester phosphodiesterase [Bacillus sp. SD088]